MTNDIVSETNPVSYIPSIKLIDIYEEHKPNNISIVSVEDVKIRGAGPDKYQCEVCGKGFKSYGGYVLHEAKVHGDIYIPEKCPMCDRKFINKKMMKLHMRKHEEFMAGTEDEYIEERNELLSQLCQEKIDDIQFKFMREKSLLDNLDKGCDIVCMFDKERR